MSTYNDIEVGKVSSTLKVIIDRVYVIGDGEEHKVNVFLKGVKTSNMPNQCRPLFSEGWL